MPHPPAPSNLPPRSDQSRSSLAPGSPSNSINEPANIQLTHIANSLSARNGLGLGLLLGNGSAVDYCGGDGDGAGVGWFP
jgi:hypothetical protein